MRHRTAVLTTAVVATALVIGSVAATVGFVESNKARRTAVAARQETDEANVKLKDQLADRLDLLESDFRKRIAYWKENIAAVEIMSPPSSVAATIKRRISPPPEPTPMTSLASLPIAPRGANEFHDLALIWARRT